MKEQDTVLFHSISSEWENSQNFIIYFPVFQNKIIKFSFRSILKEAEIDDKELVKNIQQQAKWKKNSRIERWFFVLSKYSSKAPKSVSLSIFNET